MRLSMIGRWVGRAAVFATLAAGFLAIGAATASADGAGDQPGAVGQGSTEWN